MLLRMTLRTICKEISSARQNRFMNSLHIFSAWKSDFVNDSQMEFVIFIMILWIFAQRLVLFLRMTLRTICNKICFRSQEKFYDQLTQICSVHMALQTFCREICYAHNSFFRMICREIGKNGLANILHKCVLFVRMVLWMICRKKITLTVRYNHFMNILHKFVLLIRMVYEWFAKKFALLLRMVFPDNFHKLAQLCS